MNPNEILRIVDALHRDKKIDSEIVFRAIEAAMASAVRRQRGDEAEIEVSIDRQSGQISATVNGEPLDPDVFGRIGAQTAKQVIIQKIREAERDALIEEYQQLLGEIVTGTVHRVDSGKTIVNLGNVEAILPRSEQIPGDPYHVGSRIRAVVVEVRADGSRVKVVLSRTRPQLVQRLFEQEIPEIAEGTIEIRAVAREPGYRSKVAVSSDDPRIDCVGACVGVRGNRIKNIVHELAGERIDIVRWSDDREVLIPNALQPAHVDQVLLCEMIGRAIVLVQEDQLSLAIGRKGQNVRLASKLCGIDIEIMTAEELDEQIERAVIGFSQIDGVSEELAQALVEQGYLSYDDLEVIEPDELMAMGDLTEEQVQHIVAQAERLALEAEQAATEARQRQRELERLQQAQAAAEAQAEAEQAVVSESDAEGAPTGEASGALPAEVQETEEAAEAVGEAPVEEASTSEATGGTPAVTAVGPSAAEESNETEAGSPESTSGEPAGSGETESGENREATVPESGSP